VTLRSIASYLYVLPQKLSLPIWHSLLFICTS